MFERINKKELARRIAEQKGIDQTVFKFTPDAKLKAALGWSSTYTGEL